MRLLPAEVPGESGRAMIRRAIAGLRLSAAIESEMEFEVLKAENDALRAGYSDLIKAADLTRLRSRVAELEEIEEDYRDIKTAYVMVRGHQDPVKRLDEYNERMQVAEAKVTALEAMLIRGIVGHHRLIWRDDAARLLGYRSGDDAHGAWLESGEEGGGE